MTSPIQAQISVPAERANAVGPALLCILLGAFLLMAAGFASPEAVHNAAHDTRHSFSFPCH
ncbi:MAG: CbtB domain-containing protein [Gammaproteobacteria bacterium]